MQRGGSRTTSGRALSAPSSSRATSGRTTNTASSGRASTKANFKYGSTRESICCKSKRERYAKCIAHTTDIYTVPPLALLSIPQQSALDNTEWLEEQKELLDTTFNNFHVGAHVINVSQGPAVTRFEVRSQIQV